jgi:hypothetical protein
MAKLEIAGKIVEVGDEFLQLPPDQQQQTVNEIAAQLSAPQQDNAAQLQQAGMPSVDPNAPGTDGNSPSPAFQQALAQLHQAAGSLPDAPTEDRDRLVRANLEATKLEGMMAPTSFNDASKAAQKSFLGNFGDEAYSSVVGAPMRMLSDGVDYSEGYARSQALQKEMDRRREVRSPVASMVGNIFGGVGGVASTGAGGLVERGVAAIPNAAAALPLVGRLVPQAAKTAIPTAMNALRTAAPRATQLGSGLADATALGAMYEAGDADPGNRAEAAGWGALTGLGIGLAGEGIAKVAGKVVSKFLPKNLPTAPATEELVTQSRALYDNAKALGVAVKPEAVNKLTNNVQLAAGRINKGLRPDTAAVVDDILAWKDKPLDLEALGEMQTQIRDAIKGARDHEKPFLNRIQTVLKGFADNIKPADATGDIRGFAMVKEAGKLWAKKSKAGAIEDLLDLADVDTGKYTQSGMANTIRQRMSQLYREIKKGRSDSAWTKDEIALIRQMAKGGSNSQMVNWLAKLSPKGAVSIIPHLITAVGGGAALGPAGAALAAPLAVGGYVAGQVADRGAVSAANALRDAAARGFVPKVPQLPSLAPLLRPVIGGGISGVTSIGNSSR